VAQGQPCITAVAQRPATLVQRPCTAESPATAASLTGIMTAKLVSKSLPAGWVNFRSQPAFLQGLVWVFALPVAIWLWASARSSGRAAAFSFAALLTVSCLALPFLSAPQQDSVRATATGNPATDQANAPKPAKPTSTTSTTTPPRTAPATPATPAPPTVPPASPYTAPLATALQPLSPPTPQSPEQSARAAQLLSQVSVRDETSDSGYDRDLFNHWIDANGDGCNTRCEVLRLERRATLPGLSNGGWLSLYDGKVTENPSEFDIDHVVALGEAWRSGASQWDGARRQAFANDLDDPRALIAVSASSNRSKSDSDPSGWQPPNKDYWCEYVTAWMAIKLKWDLAVDPIEFTALQSIVESC